MQDLRYAIRALRRSPGFASIAVLTLALGIGATTATYSIVDRILFQPLPFAGGDRLVRIVENVASASGRMRQRGVAYPDFLEWRTRTHTLSDVVAIADLPRVVESRDRPARLWGAMVSSSLFRALGVRAINGRTLDSGDDSAPDVVVLAFDAWQRLFHGDPRAVGSTIAFRADWNGSFTPERAGRLLTIVGVLPPSFELPTGRLDFYTPIVVDDTLKRSNSVTLIGRLGPGVSLAEAVAEANAIGAAIRPPSSANALPSGQHRFDVQLLQEQVAQAVRPAFRVFLATVAIVLLIVAANVANLLLARGTSRQREIAVRYAVGATRARIVRLLLAESAVLAAVGGALGGVGAAAAVMLVKRLAVVDAPGIFRFAFAASLLPRVQEVGVHGTTFTTALAIAAITAAVSGIVPALQVSDARELHAAGSATASPGRRAVRLRAILVLAQVLMATVLLVGAGLLVHSFVRLSTVENGYDPTNVLTFQLVCPPEYSIDRKVETVEALLARLRAEPDVSAAGFTRAGILIPEEIHVGDFVPPGRTLDDMRADPVRPRLRPVSPGYLTAVGARIVDGREFAASDGDAASAVAVVSRTVARHYFDGASPVGRYMDWYVRRGQPPVPVRVVGVIEDVRNDSPQREPFPDIFVDYRQLLALEDRWGDPPRLQNETAIGFLSFAIRTRREPLRAAPTVERIARSVDPNAGVDEMMPMERLVAGAIARPRFYAILLAMFAAVAGALAAGGVYGVLAYNVARQTRAIGIRMALGAQPANVVALVVRDGLILAAIGVAAGLAVAAGAARVLQTMLFGVTALDPITFAAVPVLFAVAALVPSIAPARRATAVDPVIALRTE